MDSSPLPGVAAPPYTPNVPQSTNPQNWNLNGASGVDGQPFRSPSRPQSGTKSIPMLSLENSGVVMTAPGSSDAGVTRQRGVHLLTYEDVIGSSEVEHEEGVAVPDKWDMCRDITLAIFGFLFCPFIGIISLITLCFAYKKGSTVGTEVHPHGDDPKEETPYQRFIRLSANTAWFAIAFGAFNYVTIGIVTALSAWKFGL